jgi:hypothetical protein
VTTTIEIRDANLDLVGQVDDFTKLEAVLRFNLADSWILDLPARYASDIGPGAGIVVRRGTDVLFSGPVTKPERNWDKDTDSLTVAGVSDDGHVEDRLAFPSAPPYTGSAYDVRTGAAETVMRAYVNANAGPGAASARQVAGLVLAADGGLGSTVTGRARFDVLGDLLRSLAVSGGDLGFRIVQNGAALTFEVYEPEDRSATVKFSPALGNLHAFTYAPSAPEGNYVIVGGGGEGTARVFSEGGDSASITRWGRRIETFRDRRDTTNAGELAQSRDEELASKAGKMSLTIEPVDTSGIQFLRDYRLGDLVAVEVDGSTIVDVVREVKLTISPAGETVAPTVGTPEAIGRGFLGLFGTVRALGRKVGHLERRF